MTKRVFVNANDIARLYGVSKRTGERKLKEMKQKLEVEDLTIFEFCKVKKIPEHKIPEFWQ